MVSWPKICTIRKFCTVYNKKNVILGIGNTSKIITIIIIIKEVKIKTLMTHVDKSIHYKIRS